VRIRGTWVARRFCSAAQAIAASCASRRSIGGAVRALISTSTSFQNATDLVRDAVCCNARVCEKPG